MPEGPLCKYVEEVAVQEQKFMLNKSMTVWEHMNMFVPHLNHYAHMRERPTSHLDMDFAKIVA
jgi:hypothetical protein